MKSLDKPVTLGDLKHLATKNDVVEMGEHIVGSLLEEVDEKFDKIMTKLDRIDSNLFASRDEINELKDRITTLERKN